MPQLTIGEAASVLNTAVTTLRSWEQRHGYPIPRRSDSGRRLYDEGEIVLLADALRRGLGISSAIRQVREQTGSHAALLREAFLDLDHETCDGLLETAIALRGVSRAFDEAVLAAVENIAGDDAEPGVLALSVEWTRDRTCWARRHAADPARLTMLVVDGSEEDSATRAASYVLQLQLALRGTRTLSLSGPAAAEYRNVMRRVRVQATVVVGHPPRSWGLGQSILAARCAAFRTGPEGLGGPCVQLLPSQPREAAEALVASAATRAELAST